MDEALVVLQKQLASAEKRVAGLRTAIKALGGTGTPHGAAKASSTHPKGKRVISAAGRRAMAAAAKRMWRQKKAKSRKAPKPTPAAQ